MNSKRVKDFRPSSGAMFMNKHSKKSFFFPHVRTCRRLITYQGPYFVPSSRLIDGGIVVLVPYYVVVSPQIKWKIHAEHDT